MCYVIRFLSHVPTCMQGIPIYFKGTWLKKYITLRQTKTDSLSTRLENEWIFLRVQIQKCFWLTKSLSLYCYEINPYAAPVRRLWVLELSSISAIMTHRGWRHPGSVALDCDVQKTLEAEAAFAKERAGSGNRDGVQKELDYESSIYRKGNVGLNGGHLPERASFSQFSESRQQLE